MNKIFNLFLAIAIILIFSSCKTAQNEKTIEVKDETSSNKTNLFTIPQDIAPGTCRILATVISIDSVLESRDPDSPCAKAPCNAIISVDSLIGYGSSFPNTFSKGQQISVHFKFTTAPTENLFPELSTHFTGVNVGAAILTDIEDEHVPGMQEAPKAHTYNISGYEVK